MCAILVCTLSRGLLRIVSWLCAIYAGSHIGNNQLLTSCRHLAYFCSSIVLLYQKNKLRKRQK